MIRERLSFFKSPHWVAFFLYVALCLTGPFACTGGMDLAGGASLGAIPQTEAEGEEAIGVAPPPFQGAPPPPIQGGSPNATAPDIMGPKGDDSHLGDNDWTAAAVISDGQRMRYGPIAENTSVMDPDAEPSSIHIPYNGTLNLLVELYFQEGRGGAWTSEETGPYLRMVYLPYLPNGELSMNGFFSDVRLTDKNAEGFNVVFSHLKLNPGEISIWYYERGSMPVKKQTWDAAIFLPPPLHISFQEEMSPIHFNDFWNFAAEPFTRHLGTFRQVRLSYGDQPNQNYNSRPVF